MLSVRVRVCWTETVSYEQEFEVPRGVQVDDFVYEHGWLGKADYTRVALVSEREVDGWRAVSDPVQEVRTFSSTQAGLRAMSGWPLG